MFCSPSRLPPLFIPNLSQSMRCLWQHRPEQAQCCLQIAFLLPTLVADPEDWVHDLAEVPPLPALAGPVLFLLIAAALHEGQELFVGDQVLRGFKCGHPCKIPKEGETIVISIREENQVRIGGGGLERSIPKAYVLHHSKCSQTPECSHAMHTCTYSTCSLFKSGL